MSKPKFEIKGREVFRGEDKIGFLNDPDNHFQATRGNAEHREEFLAWHEKHGETNFQTVPDGVQGEPATGEVLPHETKDGEENIPALVIPTGDEPKPPVQPTAPPVIPTDSGEPTLDPIPQTAPPALPNETYTIPDKEPRIRPGIGVLDPEYVRWAWHQSEDTFKGAYKKSKADFKKEHGDFLARALGNLAGKGGDA